MPEDKIERAKEIIKQMEVLQTELDTIEELLDLNDKNTMTDTEKAVAFDKLFDVALAQVKYAIAHGRDMKDYRYYMYETAMLAALGENVFHVLNAYVN